MFQALKCLLKGHIYVDSRSQPGTQVCVRCRHRRPFEGLDGMPGGEGAALGDASAEAARPADSAPPPLR